MYVNYSFTCHSQGDFKELNQEEQNKNKTVYFIFSLYIKLFSNYDSYVEMFLSAKF